MFTQTTILRSAYLTRVESSPIPSSPDALLLLVEYVTRTIAVRRHDCVLVRRYSVAPSVGAEQNDTVKHCATPTNLEGRCYHTPAGHYRLAGRAKLAHDDAIVDIGCRKQEARLWLRYQPTKERERGGGAHSVAEVSGCFIRHCSIKGLSESPRGLINQNGFYKWSTRRVAKAAMTVDCVAMCSCCNCIGSVFQFSARRRTTN